MRHWSRLFTLTLLMPIGASSAHASLTREERGCINAMNQQLAKVTRAVGREVALCVRDFARDKGVSDVLACVAQDRKGRIERARRGASKQEARKCASPPSLLYCFEQ